MIANPSTPHARKLRQNTTDAEALVWAQLRNRGLCGAKFKRQVPIAGYFADFACIEARLIVEIDGGQHDVRQSADAQRTAKLETEGYRVLRFWNHDVMSNIEGVIETIERNLKKPK